MEFIYKEDDLLPIKTTRPNYLTHNIKGSVFHGSYLDYLYQSYSNHYGIEVKPDFIWFTILNEISRAIKENSNQYRSIFTNTEAKKEASVYTNDPIIMPIESLLERVFALIPSELKKSDIVLNFSTTTDSARIAFSTAFLEAASPYYTYSMFMCGFNKIKVLGTIQDYELMKQALTNLSQVFEGTDLVNYFTKAASLIDEIINGFEDSDFWKDIFHVQRCGSGHQEKVRGWFVRFYYAFKGLNFISSYPKHKSVLEYKNLSTGLSYKMDVGLLSSLLQDGYLVPDFEFGVNEVSI